MTKPGACSLYTDRFLRTEALLLWEKGEPPVFLKPPLYDARPDFWKRRCAQLLTNGMETSRVILKFIM